MKTTKTLTDDNQAKVVAEFDDETLQQFKRKAARKIATSTRIPGFRPGKAPYNTVLSYVGDSAITRDALEMLLDEFYPKILDQEGLDPYQSGSLDNISSENPPIFELTIPLMPKIELIGLDSLHKEYEAPVVSDEDLEHEISHIMESLSELVPVDVPVADGHTAFYLLSIRDLNASDEEAAELLKDSARQVTITTDETARKSENWNSPFADFPLNLVGHRAGDVIELDHSFPEDDANKDLAGKSCHLVIKLQSVKESHTPELTDELIREQSGVESVERYRELLKKQMQRDRTAQYEDGFIHEVVESLRQQSQISFPPQMLEDQIEQMVASYEERFNGQGFTMELYLKIMKMDREQFIDKEIRPHAKESLESSLVYQELQKALEVKPDNAEVESAVGSVINSLAQSNELEKIQKKLGKTKFSQAVFQEAYQKAMEVKTRKAIIVAACPRMAEQQTTEEDAVESPLTVEDNPASEGDQA